MHGTRTFRAARAAAPALLAAVGLAGCGSGGGPPAGNARELLNQTFSSSHKVASGVMDLVVSLDPIGSSTLRGPISFGLSGPFQSRGAGRAPASDVTLSFNAPGRHGRLEMVSTGTAGYLVAQGRAYRLGTGDLKRLQARFEGTTPGPGPGPAPGGRGIHPSRWLEDPRIVGHDTISGVPTTHVRARVNMTVMLADVHAFLQRRGEAAARGSGRPATLPLPALTTGAAPQVDNPRADVWTGTADRTLRRLAIRLTIRRAASSVPGAMTSTAVSVTLQYSELNRPQSIATPTGLRPGALLPARLRVIAQQLGAGLSLGGLGGLTGGG